MLSHNVSSLVNLTEIQAHDPFDRGIKACPVKYHTRISWNCTAVHGTMFSNSTYREFSKGISNKNCCQTRDCWPMDSETAVAEWENEKPLGPMQLTTA
jgi:hypothetical protein